MKKIDEFMTPKMTYGDTLRFTPYAYAKLLYMQRLGDTEVAGYCITGTDDPLLITDFKLIKQECTSVEFDLDKDDMAEYQESMIDAGLAVWQSSRILAHTHPGNSPNPSLVDEENFKRSFTIPDWAIMFIIADSGDTYCRMKINVGPGVVKEMDVEIDWSIPFGGSDCGKWFSEYKDKVSKMKFKMTGKEKLAPIHNDAYIDPMWRDTEEDGWMDVISDAKRDGILRTSKGASGDVEVDEIEEYEIYWDGSYLVVWDDDEDVFYCYNQEDEMWSPEDDPCAPGVKSDKLDKPWVGFALAWANKNPCIESEEAV